MGRSEGFRQIMKSVTPFWGLFVIEASQLSVRVMFACGGSFLVVEVELERERDTCEGQGGVVYYLPISHGLWVSEGIV